LAGPAKAAAGSARARQAAPKKNRCFQADQFSLKAEDICRVFLAFFFYNVLIF
jgi:hypothetical protein